MRAAFSTADTPVHSLQFRMVVPCARPDAIEKHDHNEEGMLQHSGVATSRIDKYESSDWRQGVRRENMSRLKTVSIDCLTLTACFISSVYCSMIRLLIRSQPGGPKGSARTQELR